MKINSLDKIKKQAIALANTNRKYLSTELELQQIEQVGDEMVKARKRWETYRKDKCFAEDGKSPCICKDLPLYKELFLDTLKPLGDNYQDLIRLEGRKYQQLISEYENSLRRTRQQKLKYLKEV